MTTIALIDKYAIIRTGIGFFLQSQLEEISVLESENITVLLDKHSDRIPDLVILGISQGSEIQNISLIKSAKKNYPSSNIILYDEANENDFYGTHTDKNLSHSSLVLNYLREGVNGYLTKLNNLTELLNCVRDVLKGKRYICNEVYDFLIYQDLHHNTSISKINNLSSREYEIANYLLEGLSTNTIAQKIGRKATTISTIKNNIFKKLDVDNVMKLQKVFYSTGVSAAG